MNGSSLSEHESFIHIYSNIQIIHNPSINHHHWFNPPIMTHQFNLIPTVFSTKKGHPPLPIAPHHTSLPPFTWGGSPPLSFPAVHRICPASHSSLTWFFSPPQKVPKLRVAVPTPQTTLQGTNISHLGKRNIIFKRALGGDMLVSRRVTVCHEILAKLSIIFHQLT